MTLLLLFAACAPAPAPVDLLARVDPFFGTGGLGFGVGSLSPAASLPGSLARVGPDTVHTYGAPGFNHCAGFHYDDPWVQAFSHTRLPGIGVSDGGALGVLPTDGVRVDRDTWALDRDPALESAGPGWYRLEVPGVATITEVAAPRAALHDFVWADGAARAVTVDVAHAGSSDHHVVDGWLELGADARSFTAYVVMGGGLTGRGALGGQPFWFAAELSEPWTSARVLQDGVDVFPQGYVQGPDVVASLAFAQDVRLRVGISSVDLEGARANLAADLPTDAVHEALSSANAAWSQVFERVEVEGGRPEEQALFATALYNTRLMPTLLTDVDGRYRGIDAEVHPVHGWDYHTDFSLWDTYRTLHPLVILLWPEVAEVHARSLTAMGQDVGWFPRWPAGTGESGSMLGNSADVVLGETYAKGVTGFPAELAFDVSWRQATEPGAEGAREDLDLLLAHGWIPAGMAGNTVAKALEYAVDDAGLSLWADALGRPAQAAVLRAQADRWRNHLDPTTGFMHERTADGALVPIDDPNAWNDDAYTEGNAWQYAWLVPHDPVGLAEAHGSRELFVERLSTLFEETELHGVDDALPHPWYWHGNEPDLHAAFLFAAAGRPDLTWRWADWVRQVHYQLTPDGLPGNDDGGTMSAWYVFTGMGLYPFNGTTRYVLLPPRFDQVRVRRPDGDLVIRAEGTGIYLAGATLDGAPLDGPIVDHQDLTGGRTLVLQRSPEPVGWGTW